MEALKNFLLHLAMYASVALLFLFVFGLLTMLYDFARVLFGFGPRRRRRTLAERLTNRTKGEKP